MDSDTEGRCNYYLCGACVCEETGKEDSFLVPFSFKDEDLFDMWNDMLFDDMGDGFNMWLCENGHETWVLDDILEADRQIGGYEIVEGYVMVDE